MQQVVITILFICFFTSFVTGAAAADYPAGGKTPKSFNLNLTDHPPSKPVETSEYSYNDDEPSAGNDEQNVAQSLKLKPEFFYGKKDDDYNNRLDQYDTEFKLKVKVPVDFK